MAAHGIPLVSSFDDEPEQVGVAVRRTGAAILALDGVIQTAGLAMIIAGYAAPKLELVPSGAKVTLSPVVSSGFAGLTLSGNL